MKYQTLDRVTATGLGAYLRQVDLSLHRAHGHPRYVLSDYLRERSAEPRTVCDHFWKGVRLGPHDQISGPFLLLKLRLMNFLSRDPVFSACFFPLANDALRRIAEYLDDSQALVDAEAVELRMALAHLNEELARTLRTGIVEACGEVEHFNHNDHRPFRTVDEIVGRKWIP